MVIEVQANKDELAIKEAMANAPALPSPPSAGGDSKPSETEVEQAISTMEAALANPSLAGLSMLQRSVEALKAAPQVQGAFLKLFFLF